MNNILKRVQTVLVVFLLAAIFLLVKESLQFHSVASQNPSLDLSPATPQRIQVKAPGDVESDNQATLDFLSSGRVSFVNVKEGDSVKVGDILASLDTTQAAAAVEGAQANYNSSQAAVDKVIDDIHLFQYGNGGQGNVGTANENATQKAQRQEVESARDVAFDNLKSAQKNLQLQTIVAPFDGVVSNINNVSVGQNVNMVSPSSLTLSGKGDLRFVAQVSESDINSIKLGDKVSVKLDSSNMKPIDGSVSKVDSVKSSMPDGSVFYRVDVDNFSFNTFNKSGLTGTALIEASSGDQAISLPSWLVLSGHYVWVMDGDRPHLKQVSVVSSMDGKTEITSGLMSTDKIILNPMYLVAKEYSVI